MLLNVGSGGGAAAAPTGGATGGAGAEAPVEEKKEEKEEGTYHHSADLTSGYIDMIEQRKRSRTKTWVSVSSTRSCCAIEGNSVVLCLRVRHASVWGARVLLCSVTATPTPGKLART